MEFEWDEHKRRTNITKHGVDFLAASQLFDGRPIITVSSTRPQEERFLTVGQLADASITVVWTRRDQTICLISAGRARTSEITMLSSYLKP